MKVSTRVGVTRRIEAGAQVQHSVDVALKTQTEAVARASVSCLAELREQLLVAGDIKVEDEPELEDVELDEEDSPEMEMDDEDEYVESEGEGEYGNPSADDMGVFRRDTYIRDSRLEGWEQMPVRCPAERVGGRCRRDAVRKECGENRVRPYAGLS